MYIPLFPSLHQSSLHRARSPFDEANKLLLEFALPPRLLEVVEAAQIEHDVACLSEIYLFTYTP